MTLSRRDFTRLLATGSVAGATVPRTLFALTGSRQETFFDWRAVGTRIHVAFGQGGNVMLLRDGGQALVSDAKNLGYGFILRREAEAMGSSLAYALNTHHHGDHVGGNAAFTPDIPLLGHATARTRLREWAEGVVGQENEGLARTITRAREENENPTVIADLERMQALIARTTPDRFVPTEELGAEREIRVGSRTVELRHIGRGHTDNDVFLFMPEENVIHTGDLCFQGRHGFMDQNGGVLSEGWQRSVQAMIDVADSETVVIPGHGDITDRAGLQRQWDYFEQLRDAVTAAVAQGMTKEQVTELEPAALADVQGSPSRNLGVVFDEVTG